MKFYTEGYYTGWSKNVTSDGKIYTSLNFVDADDGTDSMKFNVRDDCLFEGFKNLPELPKFSRCGFDMNYIRTSKGSFFFCEKITLKK